MTAIPERVKRAAEIALEAFGSGYGAEVAVYSAERRIFRLANNGITQSTAGAEAKAWLRSATAERQGFAIVPSFDERALIEGAREAAAFRDNSPPLKLEPQFEKPSPFPRPQDKKTYFESVKDYTPQKMTEQLEAIFSYARQNKTNFAGLYMVKEFDFAVFNSFGLAKHFKASAASFKALAYGEEGGKGFADGVWRDPARGDIEKIARHAIDECVLGKNPIAVPPGKYDVVLMPPAVSETIEWMAHTSFNSRSFHENTGFLAKGSGKKIAGENITIYDDGNENGDDAFVTPFDFEGVDKKKVSFLEKGIGGLPVYSLQSGARRGKPSTGHAYPPGLWDKEDGAGNIYMSPGSSTVEEMIASVKRGLYIPCFHYVNGYLDPKRALMTGLTREGAFLIENGRKTRAIKQLRWTESILEALNRLKAVGSERKACSMDSYHFCASVVPPILIEGFNFSGASVDVD